MKRKILVILTVITGIIIGGCSQKEAEEYAMMTFMIGDVKKNNIDAQIGDLIKENDVITTADNSFCDIKIGESIIRIKALSNLRISSLIKKQNMENTALGLDTGKLLCKPKKLLKDDSFLVKTPTAVAAVRGTQFAIESDKKLTTRIKVFKGEVKVAKRVKQLETSIDKVMNIAPSLKKEEKVIITADEVKKAEKVVENSLKKETAGTTPSDEVIDKVINNNKNEIVVKTADIAKFEPEDFTKEKQELIQVEQKPKEVIVKIAHAIKQEKEKPVAEGRLLVTRYDIYFIKDGKIVWEGKVINEALKEGDKLYIASGDYVYCAMADGSVLWRVNMKNDGKVAIDGEKLKVYAGRKIIELDSGTGKKL
jgi:hypothetical protein